MTTAIPVEPLAEPVPLDDEAPEVDAAEEEGVAAMVPPPPPAGAQPGIYWTHLIGGRR